MIAALNSNYNGNRLNVNGNNDDLNRNDYAFGMALAHKTLLMQQEKIYQKIYSLDNLFLAYQKARKGKTKKPYVIKFESDLEINLLDLQFELNAQFYKPLPLKTFILRDPKTRKISKSDFRDRVVHHALVNVLEPIFEKRFIYDSCANRKGKGNLFALKRFEKFQRKITKNLISKGFCLKADVKHYFQEVNHQILIQIIKRKIDEEKIIWLIEKILANSANSETQRERERESNIFREQKGNAFRQFNKSVFC